MAKVRIGDVAPDFSATAVDGRTVGLGKLQGRFVVLYFFPRAFTPGCTLETKRFRDNYGEIQELGAEVIGVSVDDQKTQCAFAEENQVSFPMIADEDASISKAYGVKRAVLPFDKRVTFIINPVGMVVAKFHHEFQVHRHLDNILEFLRGAQGTA